MSEYQWKKDPTAFFLHAKKLQNKPVENITVKMYENACSRLLSLGAEKKLLKKFYEEDIRKAHLGHKMQKTREAAFLKPVQDAIDIYYTHVGKVADELAKTSDGIPEVKGVALTKSFSFEITSEDGVPKAFWSIDPKKISEHIKQNKGIVSIPGVTVSIATKLKLTGR